MARNDIYVVGMRKEYFVDYGPGDSAFDKSPFFNKRYILFCTTLNTTVKFTITLCTRYGWCGSGYTTASWGEMDVKPVNHFGPATHLPKDHLKIEGMTFEAHNKPYTFNLVYDENVDNDDDSIETNVFRYDSDGYDPYYPSGGVWVNEDLFNKLPRALDKPPVWIFVGSSGSGKSTIGYMLGEDKRIYETDSAKDGQLPDIIWADVIIVGHKWRNINHEEVQKRLPDGCKLIYVRFTM